MYVRIKKFGTYSENCAMVLGLWVGEEVSLFFGLSLQDRKSRVKCSWRWHIAGKWFSV